MPGTRSNATSRPRAGPQRLAPERTLEVGREYRAVVADLAFARRRFPGDPVVDRLERLALAGRQAIYSGRPRNAGALLEFISRGYWRLVIEQPGVLAVSVLALAVPCVLAAIWALHDPAAALGLVPGQFKGAAHPHVRHLPLGAATQAVLASSIFTNNIRVAFLAFAGGLTARIRHDRPARLQRRAARRARRAHDPGRELLGVRSLCRSARPARAVVHRGGGRRRAAAGLGA